MCRPPPPLALLVLLLILLQHGFGQRTCPVAECVVPAPSSPDGGGADAAPQWHALLDSLPSHTSRGENSRVQIYDGFLSLAEAKELMDLGLALLAGANQTSPEYRKAGFGRERWWTESSTLRRVRERVARLTGLPFGSHEEPPMYAWSKGSRVKQLHHDQNANGRRYLTVIIYLNTVEAGGGHTIFPCMRGTAAESDDALCSALVEKFQNGARIVTTSQGLAGAGGAALWNRTIFDDACTDESSRDDDDIDGKALKVAPVGGRALLFRSAGPDGAEDPTAWHAGCATVGGAEKHILTFFRSVPHSVDDATETGSDEATTATGREEPIEQAAKTDDARWAFGCESQTAEQCGKKLEPSRTVTRAGQGSEADEYLHVFDVFLSESEVAHMSALGSQLVQTKHGTVKGYMSRVELSRVSAAKADAVYAAVADRVAKVTGVRSHRDERAYFVAQEPHKRIALPHHDLNKAPMRVATVLIFLSDAPPTSSSGSLLFPCFGGKDGRGLDDACASLAHGFREGRRAIDYAGGSSKQGWNATTHSAIVQACATFPSPAVRFVPRAGTAVLFRSATPEGTPVEVAWHAACPVNEGTDTKLTMQFFKEFPRDELPAALQGAQGSQKIVWQGSK